MSTYIEDLFIDEAEKQSAALIASSDAAIKKCEAKAESVEKKLKKMDASLEKTEAHLAEYKAMHLCPSMYAAAKKLPEAEFQLSCVRYKLAEETKEKERLKVKCHDANVLERRTKKENKELKQSFDELTAELTGEVKAKETDKTRTMMEELALLRNQLAIKTEESKKKDEQILNMTEEIKIYKESTKKHDKQMMELKEDIESYQKASEEGYIKRHAVNEAYTTELEEAHVVVTKQRDALQRQFDVSTPPSPAVRALTLTYRLPKRSTRRNLRPYKKRSKLITMKGRS
ncbi:uncharacterized protein K460DRAFT_93959 [Cucurbitaria berberidis CBS 394.84]|uniref:Uncharacterized protein n=1 Tax=Cucurbitaria berberidis CBS 394.84 TaxID=1168544 RepID=A0A9P4GEJ2_9PLEO|nr:uncharacterized protein K460DRAFT_93959 [Cucurbitaria berberidis CBS 394.84]KAF1844558.1 hypothetical protein K460DRAFT_93959 [Cucurbitaria berberidis CBS 394.84]